MTVSARTRQHWALLDWLGTLMFLAQQLRSQLDDIIPLSMDTARYMPAGQVAAVRRRPCWPACKFPPRDTMRHAAGRGPLALPPGGAHPMVATTPSQ